MITKTISKGHSLLYLPVILLLIFGIGFIVFKSFSSKKQAPTPSVSSTPVPTPAPTPREKNTYSVLLIGYGGVGHTGGGLADTIMLLYVNTLSKHHI